jgi:ubiquinone/menaquinone biosynthesis C-methylase UbiE
MHDDGEPRAVRLRDLAPNDLASRLALAIGFRDGAYRKEAVAALNLRRGSSVVELGCGSGRNFALLEKAIGRDGHIIAVDLSQDMLKRARTHAGRRHWLNIEFVEADIADFEIPDRIDGVLSTYTLVLIPAYDRVIERAFGALKVGARMVVLDQSVPAGVGARLTPVLDWFSRPFEYAKTIKARQLCDSIRRHAGNVRVREHYFGFVYVGVGEKLSPSKS